VIDFLFWCLVAGVCGPLAGVLCKPERIYEYPYFMAGAFGVFILPQAISLLRFPGAAPEHAVQGVLVVTCLCLGSCLAGYPRLIPRAAALPRTRLEMDETKLLHAGLLFVLCGCFFGYKLAHMEIMTSEGGGWTGPATIYNFFQQLCYPGFAICLRVALRRPTAAAIASTLLALVVPAQSLLAGRREPAALFAMTVGLTLFFQLRFRPPRWMIATALALAALLIPATATYRQFQLQNDWEAVLSADWFDNFKAFLSQESTLELRNAAMLIEATRRSGDYQLGRGYWNHLVFRFVPAQWVGDDFKRSLSIGARSEGVERELAAMDYTNPPGSTVTGMGDSFQQFGYFGCLFFAVTGVFFRYLWQAALDPRNLFCQLLYMQSCTCAMRSLTHWTLDFLPGLFYNAIFLGAAWLYASQTGTRRNPGSSDNMRPARSMS